MPDPYLSGARLVAAHQLPYARETNATPLELVTRAVLEVSEAAELDPSELDGLAVSSFELAPDNAVTVAEHLGLSLNWAWQGAHGGASGVLSVLQAAEAVTLGRAQAVACVAADAFTVGSHNSLLGRFNTAMTTYLGPYGFGGANGLFALVERVHRDRYGTTREQLGKLAVTQREHAHRNPNALFRGHPLSLEDYLTARPIADPIRLYDCVMPCSGADAVMVVSEEVAARIGGPAVAVLAGGQRHNHLPEEILSLTTGAAAYAEKLFATAGVTHADLDLVELYDDYPIMVLIQLEDLGFVGKGAGGRFVELTDFGSEGELPLNTGGGQLSAGQAGAAGGMIGMYEGVTQLLGRAGERQVRAPRAGLVSGFGMVGYGKGLSSATAVLELAA